LTLGLHGFEKDRFMLAAMHLASIDDLADVEPVLEQMGKRSDAVPDAAAPAAIATATEFGPDALPIELREQSASAAFFGMVSAIGGAPSFKPKDVGI
jgi:hypothetical protein